MSNLEVSIEDQNGESQIYLSGDLTAEFTTYQKEILKEAKDKVRFFLGEISSIDKDGAASWAELLTTLAEKSSIEFEEVNYILLEEGCRNLEIFAHGEVVSFYLDLECEPCQKISSIKFSSAEAAEAALEKSGLFVCEVCNGQLDVIVEGIPAFLDYLKAQ